MQTANIVKKKKLLIGNNVKPSVNFYNNCNTYNICRAEKVYEKFVAIGSENVHSRYEINLTVSHQISAEEQKNIVMLALLCTVNRQMREFQYKLMHGVVYLYAQINK